MTSCIAIADRVGQLHRSGIRAVMALAAQRAQSGREVIRLEVGQPDFPTPAHIVEAAVKAARDGLTGYTPNAGIPSLREAVAARVATRSGRPVTAENVCITSGAVMAIQLALLALIEPGDEVLLPDPGWPNYRSAVMLAGGVATSYPLDPAQGFALDAEVIAAHITPRTRVIIINSPGNPTGATFGAAEIKALLELARRHNLFVISDEVYEDFVFDGAKHVTAFTPAADDRVILVSGASKSYAMTGWRIGWLVAHPAITAAAAALVEPQTSCPSSLSQVAAEAAVCGPQDVVELMRATYERRARLLSDKLAGTGLLLARPAGAFYAMIDIRKSGRPAETFVRDLLEATGVAVAPGDTFGQVSANSVRLSLASADDEIAEGLSRLIAYLG